MFSKACEYGIRATIYVAGQSLDGKRSNLKEISAGIKSPEAFTAKVLQQLTRHSIIVSAKGATGGFGIAPEQLGTLTVSQVITAIDGDGLFHQCVLGLDKCSDKNPCPLHQQYHVIRNELAGMAGHTLVVDLVRLLKKTVLKT